MNILLLGMTPSPLRTIVESADCRVLETDQKISVDFLSAHSVDFAVSYRYRHIITRDIIDYLRSRVVNLHISYLPWNRGADPNLWSFLEDTPKGITIHYIDEGIDTGDIIAQRLVDFDINHDTLSTSYQKLNQEITRLFVECWSSIRAGACGCKKQPGGGSFHRMIDKIPFQHLFEERGWDTPVKELIGQAIGAEGKGYPCG